uniref:Uncharacterized protein n=1 Tax=viral metagenome TaxID=1070528 RepID=A0A6M3IZD1_9ZZZZ
MVNEPEVTLRFPLKRAREFISVLDSVSVKGVAEMALVAEVAVVMQRQVSEIEGLGAAEESRLEG